MLQIDERQPDLVLLDWMLPKLSGIEVCRRIRGKAETRNLPIIMLTARGEVMDRIVGLELGADDYLPKPVNPVLLRARIGSSLEKKRLRDQQKELVRRFLWAYLKAEETLSKNKDVFADAYSKYTGLPLNVTKESAKIIKLGGVLTKDQVSRLAEAAFKQGIVQKDVTKEAAALYDDSMVVELKK